MAWLYVPESVGLNLVSSSHSATHTAVYVTSSGKPSLRPSSWRGWKTRPWIKRLSGTTLPHSTAQGGVDEWISSLPDTLASRSAPQEVVEEPTTLGTCGRISQGSSAKSGRPYASLRTSLATLGLDWSKCEQTFAEWVTQLRRDSSVRQKSARRNIGSGCSSWPTPTASDAKDSGARPATTGKSHPGMPLPHMAKSWATPTARDWKDGANPSQNAPTNGLLGRQAPRWVQSTGQPMRLNPQFVEMLMGLPIGWTDSELSATAWSHWLRRMRSELSRLES